MTIYRHTFIVKLADFGLSKFVPKHQLHRLKSGDARMMMASAQGSPAFMPPELFELCMVSDSVSYSASYSVW